MKKFFVLFVVVAMTCFSAMAFAADVTVGGSLEVRSRNFSNLDLFKSTDSSSDVQRDTQQRIRLDVAAKAGDDVKGKIQIEQDFGSGGQDWGTCNGGACLPSAAYGNTGTANGTAIGFREAWISFNVPGVPVNVTAGHQLLMLGEGGFFRSMHYGSDAWVVANVTGNNTLAFVDWKVMEGAVNRSDDIDAYVLLDVYKIDDKNTVGINITQLNDPYASISSATGWMGSTSNLFKKIELTNYELTYGGALGPVNLKAEVDFQQGKATASTSTGKDVKFKGNLILVKGNLPVDPLTINFTLARGSGNKNADVTDGNQFVNALDVDPHYTFLYEYKLTQKNAANYIAGTTSSKNMGFANTTALNIGATFAAMKNLNIGANLWFLQATEKVADVKNGGTAKTNELGNEIDVNIAWKLYDNLTWNWDLGYFMPGKGMGKDAATGIQGVLAFKF